MTSKEEINHYQEQIKTLLLAKRRRLEELQEINDRLAKMGYKSTSTKSTPTAKSTPIAKSTPTAKSAPATKKVAPKSGSKPVAPKKAADKVPKINATVKSMMAYLDLKGIEYGSHDTRKELENIVRKHNLVRKVQAYHEVNS